MLEMQHKKMVGARIVYYRKISGMTQEYLAELVGISPQYLSKIENGNYNKNISLSVLIGIAEKLNVKIAQLVQDIDSGE